MNGFGFKLKKFFTNKNTITIFGIIVILVLIYYGYNTQVNTAIVPVEVPVAAYTIQPKTKITNDMITYVEVPNISVSSSVVTLIKDLIGKYTNVNTVIPAGSMFYKEIIVEADDLPDYAFSSLEEGQIPVFLGVDLEKTYGNSIYPGNLIDFYMKGTENGKPFVGKLVENVKVLAVKDSNGQSVFENTSEERTPSSIIFGVPQDIFMMLLKAKYIADVELIIVPKGGSINEPGAVTKGLDYLVEYIAQQTIDIEPTTDNNNITPSE